MKTLFKKSKRKNIAYFTFFICSVFVFLGLFLKSDLTGLAACILSLNTVTASYIFGESKRPSK